mmetsp:Transcript_27933/g.77205  ORF Transcript_27933/g.77205 Transcript_27933/m.77205 type:complete len:204 (-) Transcript_27933:46-657(-)
MPLRRRCFSAPLGRCSPRQSAAISLCCAPKQAVLNLRTLSLRRWPSAAARRFSAFIGAATVRFGSSPPRRPVSWAPAAAASRTGTARQSHRRRFGHGMRAARRWASGSCHQAVVGRLVCAPPFPQTYGSHRPTAAASQTPMVSSCLPKDLWTAAWLRTQSCCKCAQTELRLLGRAAWTPRMPPLKLEQARCLKSWREGIWRRH